MYYRCYREIELNRAESKVLRLKENMYQPCITYRCYIYKKMYNM